MDDDIWIYKITYKNNIYIVCGDSEEDAIYEVTSRPHCSDPQSIGLEIVRLGDCSSGRDILTVIPISSGKEEESVDEIDKAGIKLKGKSK